MIASDRVYVTRNKISQFLQALYLFLLINARISFSKWVYIQGMRLCDLMKL